MGVCCGSSVLVRCRTASGSPFLVRAGAAALTGVDAEGGGGMDPVQLATAAVAVLAPFLATLAGKAGEKVTESLAAKAGAGAGGAVDGLYKAIRDKFAGEKDEDAQQSLKSLEA